MTANRNFKRRVRARALKTGESYTAALRHFQQDPLGDSMFNATALRLATAQHDAPQDPRESAAMHSAGEVIRQLMSQAHAAGARLIHFCEGALCTPNKRLLSSAEDRVAAADWSRFQWAAQQAELRAIADHAGAWAATCAADAGTTLTYADLDLDHGTLSRAWRRKARGELYAGSMVTDDPRLSRDSF